MENEIVKFLRIPLYKLYYIDTLDDYSGLTDSEIQVFCSEYSESVANNILRALEWGVNNPNYNFSSLLPNLKFSNKDIYRYICILDKQFQEYKNK